MSILRDVFGSGSSSPVFDPGPWGQGMIRLGGDPVVGSSVDTEQAMRLSAVFACLRLLSEAISTMPLDVFFRSGGTRQPFRPKPDYLTFQPPLMSRSDYLSQVMLSLLTAGNAFVATPRDDLGVPLALIPIDPTRVKVQRSSTGQVSYRIGENDYTPLDVMHIKGMSLPGALMGLSPLRYAAETVDLGLSAQRYGAAFFANGAVPGAVIEAPNDFSQPAAERFQAMWNSRHQGVSNAARVGVLVNGAKLNKVSINPDEAQFLQTRQFQVPDVARIFGVPPHLIADASNSTSWGSGLEEQNLAFGQFSLRPWVERIEDAHGRLLTTHGLPMAFVKLNMDALLRAGTKDRYDAYALAVENGWMTVDEVRRLEDMPPFGGASALPRTPPPAPPAAPAPAP